MKIGIDARFVGPQGTGLGKYTEKLILNLARIDHKNNYAIFLRRNNWDYLTLTRHKNFTKVLADVSWYSLKEQLKMPKIFSNQQLDLLHMPHFNAPILYRGKFVVTIHDLIHHYFQEQSATTRNKLLFKVKRLGYKIVIDHAVKNATKIIVPSNFVKEEVIKNFKIDPSKIIVTYEAAEEEYFSNQAPATRHQQPYLIYVGNAYPHKNLGRLLQAFKVLIGNLKLVIVCPRDVFSERLQSEIKSRNLESRVEVKGYLKPNELARLFQRATAYVFPSLSEGFGIPGLNAMASGLPVVCSDVPTLKEVYDDAALYFDPEDPEDIAAKINLAVSDSQHRSKLISRGYKQVQKYSWQKMAEQTLKIYRECI